MKVAVILPAAGMSRRFNAGQTASGGGVSKLELDLAGRPVFLRAVELFVGLPQVTQTILAVNPDTLDEFKFRWGQKLSFMGVTVVGGGRIERWETVLRALEAVAAEATHVAVHDAARPLTSVKLINRVFEAAEKYGAAIPGIPASATLKKVAPLPEASGDAIDELLGGGKAGAGTSQVKRVTATVDRADVVEIQTPQVFEVNLLRQAYARITQGKIKGAGITDDAGLVEALGQTVVVVDGESTNLKVTRPEDIEMARAWLEVHQRKQAAATAKKRLFADEDE